MEYALFYCKLSRAYAMRSREGINDQSCIIRTFEADSFESAVFNCVEIAEDMRRSERIPVILIEYLEEPTYTTIRNNLTEFQRIVGGMIDVVNCCDVEGVDIICNDEGKLMKLPLNRSLKEKGKVYDIVAGNMIILDSDAEGETVGLIPSKAAMVHEAFMYPEMFILDDSVNEVEAVSCSLEMARIMKINFIPNVSLKC